ncbi:carbohydrate ABC transporter permease [Allonocardiopsis opalescens]|uniref:Multiple sugar transport system permease protein/lactose/L-arabinose transport system permease protein n=1 Tax=Allonocardiopsis opalescens TaxID=1144618 RepID=A0A2T0QF52_9ACTN|nr:sugar ABC transporter permease [Allonocardiopsis opalescens]PRY02567.1 multiple sugar transport system permease protein/lactose/L-arabinose transport system permease protein [Allonocardiopsis opalescens]
MTRAPYLFISPFFVLYALFMLVPILVGIALSFTEWTGLGTPVWVGFRNYTELFRDPSFWTALGNTAIYTVVTMAVVLPLSLFLAMAINARGLRLRDMFRAVFFIPVVVSPIVIALVFGLFFDQQYGLVNALLRAVFGFGGIEWLTSPAWAKVVVIILVLWRWTGYLTIFFLAGLQNIPRELYEAASLDGAGDIRSFWHVTLPQMKPISAFIAVTVLVSTAQIFEEPFLLTRGGPGEATMSIAQFIYRAGFERQEFGYAAAGGVVMFLAVFVIGRMLYTSLGIGKAK